MNITAKANGKRISSICFAKYYEETLTAAAAQRVHVVLADGHGLNTSLSVTGMADHRELMKDEVKLVTTFLLLNFFVVALAVAGYQKAGMNLSAVVSHLGG